MFHAPEVSSEQEDPGLPKITLQGILTKGSDMKPLMSAVVVVVSSLVTSAADGQVTFYLSPGSDPNGDLPFQQALGVPLLEEFDFENFNSCDDVNQLKAKDLSIDLELIDESGSPDPMHPTTWVFGGI